MTACAVTHRITSTWRAGPPVSVVATPADLPVPAPDDVRGMFWRGEAWVVASNHPRGGVARTLAHEAVGHHGLRQLLGPAWREFMVSIRRGAGADPKLGALQAHIGEVYGPLRPAQLGDEIAAHLAERLAHPINGRLRPEGRLGKLARAAFGWVARERLYLDRPVDAAELEGTLVLAEQLIQRGRLRLAPWVRVRYSEAMSKPSTHRPYSSAAEQEHELRQLEQRESDWEGLKFGGGALLCLAVFLIGTGTGVYQLLAWLAG